MLCIRCSSKVKILLADRCSCGNEKFQVHKYCKECAERLGVCEFCGQKLEKKKRAIQIIGDALAYLTGRSAKVDTSGKLEISETEGKEAKENE